MFNHTGQYAMQAFKVIDRVEMSGIWASPQHVDINVLYDGLSRTIMFPGFTALSSVATFISSQLPDSSLYPLSTFSTPIIAIDNGIIAGNIGIITIQPDGSIEISMSNALYSGVGQAGFTGFSLTYITNPTQ